MSYDWENGIQKKQAKTNSLIHIYMDTKVNIASSLTVQHAENSKDVSKTFIASLYFMMAMHLNIKFPMLELICLTVSKMFCFLGF